MNVSGMISLESRWVYMEYDYSGLLSDLITHLTAKTDPSMAVSFEGRDSDGQSVSIMLKGADLSEE